MVGSCLWSLLISLFFILSALSAVPDLVCVFLFLKKPRWMLLRRQILLPTAKASQPSAQTAQTM